MTGGMNNSDTKKSVYLGAQKTLGESGFLFDHKHQHIRHINSECFVYLRLRSSKWCTQSIKEYYADAGVGSRSVVKHFGGNPNSSYSMLSMMVVSPDGSDFQKPWVIQTESDAAEAGILIANQLITRWPDEIEPILTERGMCRVPRLPVPGAVESLGSGVPRLDRLRQAVSSTQQKRYGLSHPKLIILIQDPVLPGAPTRRLRRVGSSASNLRPILQLIPIINPHLPPIKHTLSSPRRIILHPQILNPTRFINPVDRVIRCRKRNHRILRILRLPAQHKTHSKHPNPNQPNPQLRVGFR